VTLPSVRSFLTSALAIPAILLATSQPVQAQAPQGLARGTLSLELALPEGGGGNFGLWNQVGTSTSIGWNVGFAYANNDTETVDRSQLSISVGPELKEHFSIRPRVAPFYRFGIFGLYDRDIRTQDELETRTESWGVGGSVALGVDWFPLDQISIGGHTGFRVDYLDAEDRTQLNARTFLSQLTMRIYF
jgi:hypothetical protein